MGGILEQSVWLQADKGFARLLKVEVFPPLNFPLEREYPIPLISVVYTVIFP